MRDLIKVRTPLVVIALCLASTTGAQFVVAPNGNAATEGNSNYILPFYSVNFMRYQQVYAASQFADMAGGVWITAMRFRPDSVWGDAFSQSTTIDTRLSTTQMNPDGLNNLFANNVGPDEVQVFDGAVTLSSANTGSGPRDFDIVLPFATPFFYDPANGNLLWEVRRRSATTSLHYLDAEDTLGDSVSVLYNEPNFGAETGVPFTIGVVTRFDYTPVPEPVTLAIFASGTLALLGRRRRR